MNYFNAAGATGVMGGIFLWVALIAYFLDQQYFPYSGRTWLTWVSDITVGICALLWLIMGVLLVLGFLQ